MNMREINTYQGVLLMYSNLQVGPSPYTMDPSEIRYVAR